MQLALPPVTIGWIVALLVLILVVVFLFIGVPDPKVLLVLVGGCALSRLL